MKKVQPETCRAVGPSGETCFGFRGHERKEHRDFSGTAWMNGIRLKPYYPEWRGR